ncbi:MAG: hypothetical protein ACHP91_12130 [Burkholderiales bacterium]
MREAWKLSYKTRRRNFTRNVADLRRLTTMTYGFSIDIGHKRNTSSKQTSGTREARNPLFCFIGPGLFATLCRRPPAAVVIQGGNESPTRRKGKEIAPKTSLNARAYDAPCAASTARASGARVERSRHARFSSHLSHRDSHSHFEHGVVTLIAQRGRASAKSPPRAVPETPSHAGTTFSRAANLCARKAESFAEFEAAQELVRRRYAWRGYDVPALTDTRSRKSVASLAQEITFVATHDEDTVGTITLGLDGRDGLLAERTHGDAIAERRAAGANVCELTRLAVAERADSKSVLAALFNVAYAAGSVHGVTDVFIEVNPRHVGFYTRVLGFAVAAAEKFCERVQAPSVLLSLAIEELERRLCELDRALAPFGFAARAA